MVKNGEVDPNAPDEQLIGGLQKMAEYFAHSMTLKGHEEEQIRQRRIYAIRQRIIKENRKLLDKDPDNAMDIINEKINKELKKARLL